ncbi:ABC transporter substrate-binding protein [Jatrophihabitans endophyticus]|uniref:ABC transporter substrate-binding protein n=1 Tax=Jatrophihabitans endophyticus TaxID=1206085 RepID=UPI001A034F6A|nr:ABC transporter substrate-binding protein [Jatrophihabitans endophyticus]MBE7189080.1 ABC transporter substrate-binding protein [Jatrophihabitans endophyticus]
MTSTLTTHSPRRSGWRRAAALTVAAAAAVTLAACSSSSSGGGTGGSGSGDTGGSGSGSGSLPGAGKPTFVLGDKNFSEEYLLGDMYQQALELEGYKVSLKPNLGSSEIADKLLGAGKIDGLPEYTGVIYTELADLGDQPKSAAVTLKGATAYEKKKGVSVLNPTPFQDKDGVAVTKSYAAQHHLSKSIGDLKSVGSFTYGGPPENRTRYQGVVGLKKAYGLNQIQFKPLSIGSQYTALDEGKVDTIAIFTTDGQLASGKYVVLPDTKGIFGFQQVVPIIRTAKLKQMGPAFPKILNNLDALLTTKAIIALNKAVQVDKQDPATVAKAFVDQNKSAITAGV